MKTTRMTIKEIVDTIPARLGLNAGQLDLSTPQKAYDFLTNQEFQIFAKASGCDHIFDSAPGNSIDLQTSYKSMYDVNNLFSVSSEKVEETQKKYGVLIHGLLSLQLIVKMVLQIGVVMQKKTFIILKKINGLM